MKVLLSSAADSTTSILTHAFQLFPFLQIPGLKPVLEKKIRKELVMFLFFDSTATCIYELSPDFT